MASSSQRGSAFPPSVSGYSKLGERSAEGEPSAAGEAQGLAPAADPSGGGASTLTLRVGGMMCNHCRSKVEKALQAVEGVGSASVDLEKELATVTGTASAETLIAAVVGAGHSAELAVLTEMVTLSVGGMMCNH